MIRTCVICGKTFDTKSRAITCGPECSKEHHRRKIRENSRIRRGLKEQYRTCSQCGKVYLVKDFRRTTCSDECKAARDKALARRKPGDLKSLPPGASQDERFQTYGVDYGKIRARELLAKVPKIDTKL